MRKIILLLLLQCSLAAVGQEKPKIFFSNKTIDLGIIPSEKTPCVSVNFIFSNKEINYDNSSNQLLKLGYKSCDSKFFENINVSESSVHKDIDLDLQKELEKKFDELFGSLDEDETNIKEENSQQENLSKDDNVIVLNDEDGNDIKFDFLDLIEYDGDEFVVLLPSDENADEVVILKVEDGETEDTESYVSVDDDLVLNNVFSIFKERFKEEFHFCESNE